MAKVAIVGVLVIGAGISLVSLGVTFEGGHKTAQDVITSSINVVTVALALWGGVMVIWD